MVIFIFVNRDRENNLTTIVWELQEGTFKWIRCIELFLMSKKDATQDTQLQELRAEIAALKASMTK